MNLNKQTDHKGDTNSIVSLCLHVADPATFIASQDLNFLLVYSVMEKINISEFVLLTQLNASFNWKNLLFRTYNHLLNIFILINRPVSDSIVSDS